MIYEFFGLPGAGKSFLSVVFSQSTGYKLISIGSLRERNFYFTCFCLLHPWETFILLYLLAKENINNIDLFKHKLRELFIEVLACEQKANRERNAIVDFGLAQFAISLFERKVDSRDLFFLVKILKPEKFFIKIVDCPVEVRKERMNKRGRIPRSSFGEEYVRMITPIWEYNYLQVRSFYLKNFKCEIINN